MPPTAPQPEQAATSADPVYAFLTTMAAVPAEDRSTSLLEILARPGGLLDRVWQALTRQVTWPSPPGPRPDPSEPWWWLQVDGEIGEFLSEYASQATQRMLAPGFLSTYDPTVICRDGQATTVERWYRLARGHERAVEDARRWVRRRWPPTAPVDWQEVKLDDSHADLDESHPTTVQLPLAGACPVETRPALFGGLQCQPRLAWDQHPAPALRERLTALAGWDADWLTARHEEADQAWSEILAHLEFRFLAHAPGTRAKTDQAERLHRYRLKRALAPLHPSVMSQAFGGMTANTVDANRSRYFTLLEKGRFLDLEALWARWRPEARSPAPLAVVAPRNLTEFDPQRDTVETWLGLAAGLPSDEAENEPTAGMETKEPTP